MSASTSNVVCDSSTLANFKSWAQAISNAFAAFGWVQTADTGQVNWGTIASVPSSTYVYEVWKANDTAASTLPIFVKVEYGFSTSSSRFRMTVGTSSNGSGTITGGVLSTVPWQISDNLTNQGGTTFPCYFSGTAGEFRVYMWQTSGAQNTGCVFVIERSKDTSGNPTADYFTCIAFSVAGGSAIAAQQSVLNATTVTTKETSPCGFGPTAGSGSGAFNGTVAAYPMFPLVGYCGNPMLGVMTVCASDVADGATVTVATFYGGTHTYIAAKGGNMSSFLGQRTLVSTTLGALMRYE